MSIYDQIAQSGATFQPVTAFNEGRAVAQEREFNAQTMDRNRQLMEIAANTEQRAKVAQEFSVREAQRAETTQKFTNYQQSAATMLHWMDTLEAQGVPENMRNEIIRGKYAAVTQSLGIDLNDPQFEAYRDPSRAMFESIIATADSELKRLNPGLDSSTLPAEIQEDLYYRGLTPEGKTAGMGTPGGQATFLERKRAGTVHDIAGVPTFISPGVVAAPGRGQIPLSTTEAEAEAANREAEETTLGKGEAENILNEPARLAKVRQLTDSIDNVQGTISEALGKTSWASAGYGSWLKVLPRTDAKRLMTLLGTIKANIGFDRLQQMREASPTGGALGQIAIQELYALQNSIQALDQDLEPAELRANLVKIGEHYDRWKMAVNQAQSAAPAAAAPAASGGGIAEGQTATNPRTGEKMMFTGGQWQPLKQPQ